MFCLSVRPPFKAGPDQIKMFWLIYSNYYCSHFGFSVFLGLGNFEGVAYIMADSRCRSRSPQRAQRHIALFSYEPSGMREQHIALCESLGEAELRDLQFVLSGFLMARLGLDEGRAKAHAGVRNAEFSYAAVSNVSIVASRRAHRGCGCWRELTAPSPVTP